MEENKNINKEVNNLKLDKEFKSKKFTFVFSAIILLISVLGFTYSWTAQWIQGDGNKVNIDSAYITLTYKGTDSSIDVTVTPGEVVIKTFEITNNYDRSVNYSLFWDGVSNEFSRGALTYSLREETLGYLVENRNVPFSNIGVYSDITLAPGQKQNFTLEIYYEIDESKNQAVDSDKVFRGDITLGLESLDAKDYTEYFFADKFIPLTEISKYMPIMSESSCSDSVTLSYNNSEMEYSGFNNTTYCEINTDRFFAYIGEEEMFTIPTDGAYILEVWGAQGGNGSNSYKGGYGAYSTGITFLSQNADLYVNVGGKGSDGVSESGLVSGGYNGGGSGYGDSSSNIAGGGGATHIASVSGTLSSLNNVNNLYIIAGGGGGGAYKNSTSYSTGGSGGGYIGVSSTGKKDSSSQTSDGGTQNSPGVNGERKSSFGIGASGTSEFVNYPGGGGGLYGGNSSPFVSAGGSGYIASPLLLKNSSYMYCYNCLESVQESIRSINTVGSSDLLDTVNCVNGYSKTPISKCAKEENGYAVIKFYGKIYSLKFMLDGGIMDTSSIESFYKENTEVLIPNPTKSGKAFIGWTRSDTGKLITPNDEFGTRLTFGSGSFTLIANWENVYVNLNIDPNEGLYSGALTRQVQAGDVINLGVPSRDGVTFKEWQIVGESDAIINNDTITMGNLQTTVKAVYHKYVTALRFRIENWCVEKESYIATECEGHHYNTWYDPCYREVQVTRYRCRISLPATDYIYESCPSTPACELSNTNLCPDPISCTSSYVDVEVLY